MQLNKRIMEDKEADMHIRLYVDPASRRIMIAETDQHPILRDPVSLATVDKDGKEAPYRLILIYVVIDDIKGDVFQLNATEFAEDLSDDGKAEFGESIFKLNEDNTVSFCPDKTKRNLATVNDVGRFRIRYQEVLDDGN